jgi:hypothetical protein
MWRLCLYSCQSVCDLPPVRDSSSRYIYIYICVCVCVCMCVCVCVYVCVCMCIYIYIYIYIYIHVYGIQDIFTKRFRAVRPSARSHTQFSLLDVMPYMEY